MLWLIVLLIVASPEWADGEELEAAWNGGAGSWSSANSWSGGVVPQNVGATRFDVSIDGGKPTASSVSLDLDVAIDSLTVDAGDELVEPNGRVLAIAGGAVVNNGLWLLASAGGLTDASFAPGAGLSGGGVLRMGDGPNNRVYAFGTTLTQAAAHSIRGAGQLLVNVGGMLNNGSIVADRPNRLLVDPDALGFTNRGMMEAKDGGTLELTGGSFVNAGGRIEAGEDSAVRLTDLAQIVGGEVGSVGDGVVKPVAAVFENLSAYGHFQQANDDDSIIRGTVTNNATWSLESAGSFTDIRLDGGATVAGTGAFVLGDNLNNRVYTLGTAFTQESGHTIRGAGQLLVNVGGMVNHGAVTADRATRLLVDPSDLGLSNTGRLVAANGGTLELSSGAFTNTGGTIEAREGSVVRLTGLAAVVGGELRSSGTGVVEPVQTSLTDVTTSGTFVQKNGGGTIVLGTLSNDAQWELRSAGTDTDIRFDGGATVDGTGAFVLGDNRNNRIYALGTVLTQESAHTIRGAGQLLVNVGGMVNRGTVSADRTTSLIVSPNALGFTNDGLLRAVNGGTLELTGGTFSNTGGSIEAGDDSVVRLTGLVPVVGGQLGSTATGVVKSVLAVLRDVTTYGSFVQEDGNGTVVQGTLHNDAEWRLNSSGSNTDIRLEGGVSVSGQGAFVLGDNPNNRIYPAGTIFTQASGHTIRGAGQLIVNQGGLVNDGRIAAEGSVPLYIDPRDDLGFTNHGDLVAAGAGGLRLEVGPFTTSGQVVVENGSSLIRAGGYTQTAGATTLRGGSLSCPAPVEIAGGLLAGVGTVGASVVSAGRVQPGNPSGVLSISGNYTQNGTGVLQVEIGGGTSNLDSGRLVVGGTAKLSGRLEVSVGAGAVPPLGATYDILTGASREGEFVTVDGLSREDGIELSLTYTATGARLEVMHEAFTPTPTHTPTVTPTATQTATSTLTASSTATRTVTPTPPPTASATASPTRTATPLPTLTPSSTVTSAATFSATPTRSATPSLSPIATMTESPSPTPTPTPTRTPALCTGDCNDNGVVSVEELVTIVNVALGQSPLSSCPNGDSSGDGRVTIEEIVQSVLHDLTGCPHR
jgi:hypothetical protein